MFVGVPNGATVGRYEYVDGIQYSTLSFATSQTTGKPAFFPNMGEKTYNTGKMYLRMPTSQLTSVSSARAFDLEFLDTEEMGNTTGICEASPLNEDNGAHQSSGEMINDGSTGSPQVYDLQGRRIESSKFKVQSSKIKRGVYIQNGRKVIVK